MIKLFEIIYIFKNMFESKGKFMFIDLWQRGDEVCECVCVCVCVCVRVGSVGGRGRT